MDNKGKPKSVIISDKINVLAQHGHVGTRVEQTSRLILSVPTLNPIKKKLEETERGFVQCRPFSKQPLGELESALAA
jgi:hypothetical protein